MPRQLTQRRVWLGLLSREVRVCDNGVDKDMATGGWSSIWELTSQPTGRKQRTHWKWHEFSEASKPALNDTPSPTRPCVLILPNSSSNWGLSSQTWTFGAIIMQIITPSKKPSCCPFSIYDSLRYGKQSLPILCILSSALGSVSPSRTHSLVHDLRFIIDVHMFF